MRYYVNTGNRGIYPVVTTAIALVATFVLLQRPPNTDYLHIRGLWIVTELWDDGIHGVADARRADSLGVYWRFSPKTTEFGAILEGECARLNDFPIPYRMDAAQAPKHLDFTENGETHLATYSLRGQTLVICQRRDDVDRRPTTVPTKGKKGDGLLIFVLKRSDVPYPDMDPEKRDKLFSLTLRDFGAH